MEKSNHYLKKRRRKIFISIASSIVPAENQTIHEKTASVADWALGRMEAKLRVRVLAFLWVVEGLSVFIAGKPFTRLSPDKQNQVLVYLESSGLSLFRMGFFGVKTYVCMGYYTRREVWEKIGYPGPSDLGIPYPDPRIRSFCD